MKELKAVVSHLFKEQVTGGKETIPGLTPGVSILSRSWPPRHQLAPPRSLFLPPSLPLACTKLVMDSSSPVSSSHECAASSCFPQGGLSSQGAHCAVRRPFSPSDNPPA